MGITVSSVMGYLFNQVGEGKIRRTDIVFSIDREIRREIERSIKKGRSASPSAVQQRLEKNGMAVSRDDLQIYLQLRHSQVELGDLYESLREIELFLHELVRSTMIEEHGADQWWHLGIPEDVRKACVVVREDDNPPADAFCYTTLIQMVKIFENRWAILSKKLPPKLAKNKGEFISHLKQVNKIRNAVMHPCKGLAISDEHFLLVRTFYLALTPRSSKIAHYSFASLHSILSD